MWQSRAQAWQGRRNGKGNLTLWAFSFCTKHFTHKSSTNRPLRAGGFALIASQEFFAIFFFARRASPDDVVLFALRNAFYCVFSRRNRFNEKATKFLIESDSGVFSSPPRRRLLFCCCSGEVEQPRGKGKRDRFEPRRLTFAFLFRPLETNYCHFALSFLLWHVEISSFLGDPDSNENNWFN